jgi:hypothetical protein
MNAMDRRSRRVAAALVLAIAQVDIAPGAEIAVLSPAYSGQLDAAVDTDITSYLSLGLSDVVRNTPERIRKFNALAVDNEFDAIDLLQKALLTQLAKVNRTAEVLPVVRRARIAPLARDEVPENSGARLLLDISIQYLGIYSSAAGAMYQPAVLLQYRWVGPSGELVEGTRKIRYNSLFLTAEERDRPRSITGQKRSTGNEVVLKAAEECLFRTFEAVQEQHQKVWGCMELAFGEIAASVAANVPPR